MQINNNKLIANFLDKNTYLRDLDGYKKPLKVYSYEDLLFDSNIDWLFEVVENIVKSELYIFEMWYSGNTSKEWICSFEVQRTFKTDKYGITTKGGKTQIDALYKAVIEFIKYYNELSK